MLTFLKNADIPTYAHVITQTQTLQTPIYKHTQTHANTHIYTHKTHITGRKATQTLIYAIYIIHTHAHAHAHAQTHIDSR